MFNESNCTVLLVDDLAENLLVISSLLSPHYRVLAASSGERCLRILASQALPHLILLDIMMPGLDGYAVLKKIQEVPETRDIPVILLTALADAGSEELGLQLGAVDYIIKPVKPAVLLARVRTQLEAHQARSWLKNQNTALEAEISRRMAENDMTQQVSIRALAHLAEIRDPETGNHILRTQSYVQLLALKLQNHPRFTDTLNARYINLLSRSAPLHDIGKVGIPDHILLKPNSLDAHEWEIMKTHSKLGSQAIEMAEKDIEHPVEFLTLAKEIARWHHEKWNGSGYPDGLSGDAIPVSARLMALADVFDALICRRVYKQALPYEEARLMIKSGSGQHFDPDIVQAFLDHFPDFTAIAERYLDCD